MAAGLKKLRVNMGSITMAMTMGPPGMVHSYLDLETSEVLTIFQEAPDEEAAELIDNEPARFLQVPRDEDGFRRMSAFAASVDEQDIRDRLELALRGKGAFRRFKDELFRFEDLKERWFASEFDALAAAATRWLEAEGFAPEYERAQSLGAAPPVEAKRGPAVDLLDLLVLGAPDGKTELIGGRVRRQVRLPSTSEARRAFRDLAMQLCAFYGVAWRKRFIENKSTYEIERARLEVADTTVVLELALDSATFLRFR